MAKCADPAEADSADRYFHGSLSPTHAWEMDNISLQKPGAPPALFDSGSGGTQVHPNRPRPVTEAVKSSVPAKPIPSAPP